jgi:hypothetical protein
LGHERKFDPGKWQKERFADLPTVFLEGLLTKLSRMKTRPPCFSIGFSSWVGVKKVMEMSARVMPVGQKFQVRLPVVDEYVQEFLEAREASGNLLFLPFPA